MRIARTRNGSTVAGCREGGVLTVTGQFAAPARRVETVRGDIALVSAVWVDRGGTHRRRPHPDLAGPARCVSVQYPGEIDQALEKVVREVDLVAVVSGHPRQLGAVRTPR